jgi:hypothetical protein
MRLLYILVARETTEFVCSLGADLNITSVEHKYRVFFASQKV